MNDTHAHAETPTCQYCGHAVEWTRKLGYAAFTHVGEEAHAGLAECPTDK